MKYTSKHIEEILTSPSAKRGLNYITPIYQEAQNALWIMQAMGLQTDLIIKWIQEYIEQILPQTATWLLPYFEKEYGIPINKELSIDERRKSILLAIRTRAPMNPVKLAGILSLAINIDNINIKENTGKNTFSVEFGDVINKEQINKVIEILNKYKPAHLIYWFNSIIKIQFQNKNNIFIKNLILSSYFKNLELDIIRLDNGEKVLNGTWNLQAKTKSIELTDLIISGYINSLQKADISANLIFLKKIKSNTENIFLLSQFNYFLNNNITQNIKTENLLITDFIKYIYKINISSLKLLINFENKNKKILVSSQFKYKVKNKISSSMNNLIINLSIKERENISPSITIDTMWHLDDTYSLDSKRRLNARKIDINL